MMYDIFTRWQELEETIVFKGSVGPVFKSVFSSPTVDMFIQSSINNDYSIILHMNNDEIVDINRENTGIKVSTIINRSVDENRPSIIIDNINKASSNIFKAFSATLYENLFEKIDFDDIENIINDTIDEYKDYFSGLKKELSDLEQQGLYGELLYLKELIANDYDSAVDCWEGIYKNKHDFVFEDKSVEIKTTRNQSRLNIHISNENQLDTSFVKKLELCVYRLEKVNVGKTVLDLYNEIKELLPVSKHNLLKLKLIKAGINFEKEMNLCKFREITKYVYDIDDAFPKIDKYMCGDRIFEVKYYVSLDGIKAIEEETLYE